VTSVPIGARGLVKRFGKTEVLRGIDLEVPAGQLCGLVGADGAGKTTLLRTVAGLYTPDAGTVRPGRAGRERIGYCPQGFHLYGELTVDENLRFFGTSYGLDDRELSSRSARYLAFAGLGDHRARHAGALSGGMQQKLALVCALVHDPPLLLLDEPTTGVDPVSRRDFWDLVQVVHASGTTIVFASGYFDEVERCERVLFLHRGRILADGAPDDLIGDAPDLEAALARRLR
jgi:ABC-type multidrug transport system ATPase subunit